MRIANLFISIVFGALFISAGLIAQQHEGAILPHDHFTKRVKYNMHFQTEITLCTFYEDTMQVRKDDRKHIPYED
jgi:hypothetical protein